MDLYIATRSDRGDIVKIGRSSDARARCTALQASQAFWVEPTVIFTGQGFRETEIHQALKKRRVEGVPSREWFNYTLADAVQAVGGQLYAADAVQAVGGQLYAAPTTISSLPEVDLRPHLEFVPAPRFASTAADVEALALAACGETWRTAITNAELVRQRRRFEDRNEYFYQSLEGWAKVPNAEPLGTLETCADDEVEADDVFSAPDGEPINDEPET
jgi:hypothetical protein